jgi:hypothetical protein
MVSAPVRMPAECRVPDGTKVVVLDGLERDRCVWVGDLAVTAKTLYVADGASGSPVEELLGLFAREQDGSGAIRPTTGTLGERLLADYTAYWIEDVHDYVLYSGDVAAGRTLFPNVVRALDRWYPEQMVDGLVANRLGKRVDYALIDRGDSFVAYYNAQYVRALEHGAKLARWTGQAEAARRWAARAEALRPVVHQAFWDAAAGAYRDTVSGPLVHPQDGNAFAVLAGVAGRAQASSALGYLAAHNTYGYGNSIADNDTWSGYPWGMLASRRVYPFMLFFEVLARFQTGLDASALSALRHGWGYMVRNGPGTTWETIGAYGGGPLHGSWAHGWSSGAAPALTSYVLGVRPTSPGFATFVVDVHRDDGVWWARGTVPTPHGPIRVAWRKDGPIEVEAPPGTRWTNAARAPVR